jgi:tetratricopeptide (TPR) repeat protein
MNTSEYESILSSAVALETTGDHITALNEYERAIKTDYERPEAYLKAAEMLLRHDGVWKEHKQVVPAAQAVQYLNDALSWNKDNVSILELLFHAQMHIGQLHRAVQTASKLMDLSPDKERWQQEGQRTFATLETMPGEMRLLTWHIGQEGISQLHKKLMEDQRAQPFFAELDAMPKDEPDIVDITNCDEVLQANRISPGPRQIAQFKDLYSRYPESGNVCALYAHALVAAGRKEEAISVAKVGINTVKCKSEVAAYIGHFYLWEGNFLDCVRWYICAAVLESTHRRRPQFTFAYLACLYSAVAVVRNRSDFELMANMLTSRADVGLDYDLRQKILEMARSQCDSTTETIMEQVAQRYLWEYAI